LLEIPVNTAFIKIILPVFRGNLIES